MTDEIPQVTLVEVAGCGSTTDGAKCFLRLRTEQNLFDFLVPYAKVANLITDISDASNAAYKKRRELNQADNPAVVSYVPNILLTSLVTVAADKSGMLLRMQTDTGQVDIRISRDRAAGFSKQIADNTAFLLASPESQH